MGSQLAKPSNKNMVDRLVERQSFIRSPEVEGVFRAVDRAMYYEIEDGEPIDPYEDDPWRRGNLHLSAPCIYAKVVEALKLRPGVSFLNLGSGTGYLNTIVGLLTGPNGINHGVELHKDVVEYAYRRLEQFKASSCAIDKYDFSEPVFIRGNCVNLSPDSSYDRIYLGAACLPDMEQFMKKLIKPGGGILVMPYENHLMRHTRLTENHWFSEKLMDVNFTLMVGRQGLPPAPGGLEPAENEEDTSGRLIFMPPNRVKCLKEWCRIAIRQRLRRKTNKMNPNLLNSDNVERRRQRRAEQQRYRAKVEAALQAQRADQSSSRQSGRSLAGPSNDAQSNKCQTCMMKRRQQKRSRCCYRCRCNHEPKNAPGDFSLARPSTSSAAAAVMPSSHSPASSRRQSIRQSVKTLAATAGGGSLGPATSKGALHQKHSAMTGGSDALHHLDEDDDGEEEQDEDSDSNRNADKASHRHGGRTRLCPLRPAATSSRVSLSQRPGGDQEDELGDSDDSDSSSPWQLPSRLFYSSVDLSRRRLQVLRGLTFEDILDDSHWSRLMRARYERGLRDDNPNPVLRIVDPEDLDGHQTSQVSSSSSSSSSSSPSSSSASSATSPSSSSSSSLSLTTGAEIISLDLASDEFDDWDPELESGLSFASRPVGPRAQGVRDAQGYGSGSNLADSLSLSGSDQEDGLTLAAFDISSSSSSCMSQKHDEPVASRLRSKHIHLATTSGASNLTSDTQIGYSCGGATTAARPPAGSSCRPEIERRLRSGRGRSQRKSTHAMDKHDSGANSYDLMGPPPSIDRRLILLPGDRHGNLMSLDRQGARSAELNACSPAFRRGDSSPVASSSSLSSRTRRPSSPARVMRSLRAGGPSSPVTGRRAAITGSIGPIGLRDHLNDHEDDDDKLVGRADDKSRGSPDGSMSWSSASCVAHQSPGRRTGPDSRDRHHRRGRARSRAAACSRPSNLSAATNSGSHHNRIEPMERKRKRQSSSESASSPSLAAADWAASASNSPSRSPTSSDRLAGFARKLRNRLAGGHSATSTRARVQRHCCACSHRQRHAAGSPEEAGEAEDAPQSFESDSCPSSASISSHQVEPNAFASPSRATVAAAASSSAVQEQGQVVSVTIGRSTLTTRVIMLEDHTRVAAGSLSSDLDVLDVTAGGLVRRRRLDIRMAGSCRSPDWPTARAQRQAARPNNAPAAGQNNGTSAAEAAIAGASATGDEWPRPAHSPRLRHKCSRQHPQNRHHHHQRYHCRRHCRHLCRKHHRHHLHTERLREFHTRRRVKREQRRKKGGELANQQGASTAAAAASNSPATSRRRESECERYRSHISNYILSLALPRVLHDYLNFGRDF